MDEISFARGVPAPECLPVGELADCARAALERDGRAALSYGPGGGYGPLREWIAKRHAVEPGRVLLTNGSLQGFVFLAERLGAAGRVLVEGPTYDRPLKVLRRLGLEVADVPLDEEGLDPDALERELDAGPASFLYTIPTFQNPSGLTLSRERRQRLAELTQERGLLVLEDDPYGLVRFEGEAQPTVFELAGGDGVIYCSSFSKTVAPGVRVGYFVVPSALAGELEEQANATYITPVLLAEATVYEFLRRGAFEQNLERVCGLLRDRRDAMLAALERELGGGEAHWSRPEGGYFLWLDLPGSTPANELLGHAAERGVTFVPGVDFFLAGRGGESAARLAFSFVSPEEIDEGVRRLAALLPAEARV